MDLLARELLKTVIWLLKTLKKCQMRLRLNCRLIIKIVTLVLFTVREGARSILALNGKLVQ